MKLLLINLLFLLISTGCVSSAINHRSAHMHATSGHAAQQNGDWDSARRHWAKAVGNSQLANARKEQLSIAYYEYGRSLGATCFYDESEKYLKKSLNIDREMNGPVQMATLELARLNLAQEKYSEAVKFYNKLPTIYVRQNAEELDPVGVADVYEEYSIALRATDSSKEAEFYLSKAKALKADSEGNPSNSDRTPYGQYCTNH
jgi:tetratricopeptide (TPR) repeat protein